MARAAALLLLIGLTPCSATWYSTPGAACPDACICVYDARLWVAHTREDSLTARCARRDLETLPRGLGSDVRHLDVAGNAVAMLRDEEFAKRGLQQLFSVDLSDNGLAEVEDGAFRGLVHLRRLFLARNRIAALPQNVFSDCGELWFLSLAGNPLTVPDITSGRPLIALPSLKVLDLSELKLDFFPDHVLGRQNSLQELIVANNSILEVRVQHLKSLRRLDVSNNRLPAISAEALAAAGELRALALSGNPLGEQPLPGSPSLRQFSVDNCGLSQVEASMFTDLPNLEELTLDSNGLSTLPADAFSALPHLRRLSLRHNRLPNLPSDVFAHNAELRALELSGNALQLSEWLVAPSLRDLGLAGCGLRALPAAAFAGVPALRNLSAAHNELQTVDAKVLVTLPRLRALDLGGNLLRCDAALRATWLACDAQHVRVAASCFDPPGDWQMLRYMTFDDPSAPIDVTTPAHIVNQPEDEEDSITEELFRYGYRWGPILGGFLFIVASILLMRKWMDYMILKNYYSHPKTTEYDYESDEDEGTTTTMVRDTGSPSVSQSVATSSPSSPPSPPIVGSPAAAKRLAASHKNYPPAPRSPTTPPAQTPTLPTP